MPFLEVMHNVSMRLGRRMLDVRERGGVFVEFLII